MGVWNRILCFWTFEHNVCHCNFTGSKMAPIQVIIVENNVWLHFKYLIDFFNSGKIMFTILANFCSQTEAYVWQFGFCKLYIYVYIMYLHMHYVTCVLNKEILSPVELNWTEYYCWQFVIHTNVHTCYAERQRTSFNY